MTQSCPTRRSSELFGRTIRREDGAGLAHRVEGNTDAVLALFEEAGVKATFFTLGWVAERYPALMRRIVDAGHEVASHGYDHKRVFTFDGAQFRADLRRSRAILEDATGQAGTGYRAPSFRSAEARVGKEGGGTGRIWWAPHC